MEPQRLPYARAALHGPARGVLDERRPPRIGVSAASVFVLCVALASATHAAEWQAAQRLNVDGVEGWFPDVAADASGRAHVVWSSGPSARRGDAVVYCSPTAEGCAQSTSLVRRPDRHGAYVTRPSPAVDRNGVFHLLWRRKYLMIYTSAPVAELFAPDQWRHPRKLGEGGYTALTVDQHGTLHAAWNQGVYQYWGGPCDGDYPCYGCGDIYYSRSDDHGHSWAIPVNVSQTRTGSQKPQIAVGADGTVYLAWEEGLDHYVGRGRPSSSMVSVSTDAGRTWNTRATFTQPGDTPQSIALAVGVGERLVVAWQQLAGTGVFFQVSDDRALSWSTPQPIPGIVRRALVNALDAYDMAADGEGHVHLVLSGRLAAGVGRNHVLHVEWDGHGWSAPRSLFATHGTSEWARIAVGNGNQLHAVWFERPAGFEWNTDADNYAVWYARGRSDAPAIAPIAFPTPVARLMSGAQAWRLLQAVLALLTVAAVILATRRRGW